MINAKTCKWSKSPEQVNAESALKWNLNHPSKVPGALLKSEWKEHEGEAGEQCCKANF